MRLADGKPLLMPAYLVACLVMGGASAAGFGSNLILQLAALPIIAAALLKRQQPPMSRAAGRLALFPLLIALLVAMQLVPLPPKIWATLPGRGPIADANRMVVPLPWEPISLAPRLTIAAAVWLLPAVAVLLGILRLRWFRPAWVAWAIIGVSCCAVALGAVQTATSASSPDGVSPAYLYDFTSFGLGVGFFANANHMATLMLATLPFVVAIYVSRPSRPARSRRSGLAVVSVAIVAMLMLGLLLNGSLAGFGLLPPVLAASVMLLRAKGRSLPLWQPLAIAAIVLAGLAAVLLAPLGNNLVGDAAHRSDLSRATTFRVGLEEAAAFAPFGSGLGSFRAIYNRREDPARVTNVFVNHVHSDYIELALETGVPGLAIIGLFLLWWVRRVAVLWRSPDADPIARAASIASAAILAHSAVDYPLRTAAISAVFAACCALMAQPRPIVTRVAVSKTGRRARHLVAS